MTKCEFYVLILKYWKHFDASKYEIINYENFTAYIIGGSLGAYQIGYVFDRCTRRQFQTLISQIMQMNSNI